MYILYIVYYILYIIYYIIYIYILYRSVVKQQQSRFAVPWQQLQRPPNGNSISSCCFCFTYKAPEIPCRPKPRSQNRASGQNLLDRCKACGQKASAAHLGSGEVMSRASAQIFRTCCSGRFRQSSNRTTYHGRSQNP